ITGGSLLLTGTGDFILDDFSNEVDILAANVTGTIAFANFGDLELGSVNSTDGIQTNDGDLFITLSATGDLVVSENVSAGSGTVDFEVFLGDVNQTGGTLIAHKLALFSDFGGNFTLAQSGNDVD